MKLTYAVEVCTEHRELEALLHFLIGIKDPEDDINVLVDTTKMTKKVSGVLEKYPVATCFRSFDGDFAAHRNYHISQCTGDYIFMIDADEMPQEHLIRNTKRILGETGAELVYVPRMNLCPGYTTEWAQRLKFTVNEVGWINWPDQQGRIFKRDPERIKWDQVLHEKVTGSTKTVGFPVDPKFGLWHIKSILKQDAQDAFYKNLNTS
jgi:hypothetical protein